MVQPAQLLQHLGMVGGVIENPLVSGFGAVKLQRQAGESWRACVVEQLESRDIHLSAVRERGQPGTRYPLGSMAQGES